MQIFHYADQSGEYLHASTTRLDPIGGKPLVPRDATPVAPPEARPGYARCWIDGAWHQVEDHRGEVLYSTVSGERVEWEELGPVPEGWWTTQAPGEHQVWDAEAGAWAEDSKAVAAARREEIESDLLDLDALAIRPLRAAAAGTDTQIDRDRVASLEAVAQDLRAERAELAA